MSLRYAPRGRPRLAAAALLVLFHVALVVGMLSMRALRERPGEGMLTILLSAPRPPERKSLALPAPTPARSLPPIVAPLPIVALPEQQAAQAPVAVAASAPMPGTGVAAASAGPASAPLNLAIPKEFFTHPPPLTPAQEAMQDPRSNHLELTRQEKLDIAFGVIECVAWERMPDGSIYRGPGHLKRIQSVGTNPLTAHKPGQEDRPMECVR